MIVIYGKRLCGKVDRVAGLFYVSTKFFHIDYFPLFPVGSYLVFEGSEKGGDFRGMKIRLSIKSVMAGYLRGLLSWFAIVTAGESSFEMAKMFLGKQESWLCLAQAGMALAACGALIFVLASSHRAIYPVLGILIVASLAAWSGLDARMKADAGFRLLNANPFGMVSFTLVAANGAACLYTMTRLLIPAGYRRAKALAEIAGLPLEVIEEICGGAEVSRIVEEDPYADQSWAAEGDGRRFE